MDCSPEMKMEAKKSSLKELIKKMYAMMFPGEAPPEESAMPPEGEEMEASEEPEQEGGLPEVMKSEADKMAEGKSLADEVRGYMKKSNKVPVKNSMTVARIAVSAKKPSKKYG